MKQSLSILLATLIVLGGVAHAAESTAGVNWKNEDGRWTAARANEWYAQQKWITGANFVPSTASNEFEMWQADSFDPDTLDRELGWAASIGFNTMRVFLHDMLWKADPQGFESRIDQYLAIADKHGIRTLLVLFDSVWDPHPTLGKQDEPVPHRHNSRWAQSPHTDLLKDHARHDELKPYVTAIVTRFKDDARVLGWDLLNEPGNWSVEYQEDWSREAKDAAHFALLPKVFAWARAAGPSQPLTVGVWKNVGTRTNPVHPLDKVMLEQSDIITFHSYSPLDSVKKSVEWLEQSGRPIICTEYMARSAGSTFEGIMPYFKEKKIGAINWGLVSGRSQTIYPWESWEKKFTAEPSPWFHDVFRKDGTPYDEKEVALIRELTGTSR